MITYAPYRIDTEGSPLDLNDSPLDLNDSTLVESNPDLSLGEPIQIFDKAFLDELSSLPSPAAARMRITYLLIVVNMIYMFQVALATPLPLDDGSKWDDALYIVMPDSEPESDQISVAPATESSSPRKGSGIRKLITSGSTPSTPMERLRRRRRQSTGLRASKTLHTKPSETLKGTGTIIKKNDVRESTRARETVKEASTSPSVSQKAGLNSLSAPIEVETEALAVSSSMDMEANIVKTRGVSDAGLIVSLGVDTAKTVAPVQAVQTHPNTATETRADPIVEFVRDAMSKTPETMKGLEASIWASAQGGCHVNTKNNNLIANVETSSANASCAESIFNDAAPVIPDTLRGLKTSMWAPKSVSAPAPVEFHADVEPKPGAPAPAPAPVSLKMPLSNIEINSASTKLVYAKPNDVFARKGGLESSMWASAPMPTKTPVSSRADENTYARGGSNGRPRARGRGRGRGRGWARA